MQTVETATLTFVPYPSTSEDLLTLNPPETFRPPTIDFHGFPISRTKPQQASQAVSSGSTRVSRVFTIGYLLPSPAIHQEQS